MDKFNLSQIYHSHAKSAEQEVFIPKNTAQWPEAWNTFYYKTYPRLPRIMLPHQDDHDETLLATIARRRSRSSFADAPLSLTTLGTLLWHSAGLSQDKTTHQNKRRYPSAGGRYPLEMYPCVLQATEKIGVGMYHYNVKEHCLEALSMDTEQMYRWADLIRSTSFGSAAVVLFITAVFWRLEQKYQDLGYRYALLEAGHLGQNVELVAEALKLNHCVVGRMRELGTETVEKILDIDGITESLVHTIALGK